MLKLMLTCLFLGVGSYSFSADAALVNQEADTVSCALPFDQGMDFKDETSTSDSSVTRHVQMGKVKVSATVDHVDAKSKWQEEWRKNKSEDSSEASKKSHAPSTSISVEWSDGE